jgi:hypothetical protein
MRVMNKDQFIHYLLGIVDGEGCFCISVKKQNSSKMKWVLDPIFHITQHSQHKEILYHFQKLLGCGIVIKKYGQKDTMQYLIQSRRELVDKLIPFFKKYKLIIKRKDFEIFAEVVDALDKHYHGNVLNFKKILPKVFLMNRGGKYRKYTLNEILNSLGSSETIRQTQPKLQKL